MNTDTQTADRYAQVSAEILAWEQKLEAAHSALRTLRGEKGRLDMALEGPIPDEDRVVEVSVEELLGAELPHRRRADDVPNFLDEVA